MATDMTLERYAAIRARVRARGELNAVLAEENVSLAAWSQARTSWSAAIDDELARNETSLVSRFVAAFKSASIVSAPRAADPLGLAPPRPQVQGAQATYQLQQARPSDAALDRANQRVAPASAVVQPPQMVRVPDAAPPALVQRPPEQLQSTALHPEGMPIPKSLPFVARATPPPPSQPAPTPATPRVGTGTSLGALPLPPSKVLPFKGGKRAGENVPGWTAERYAELCIDFVASGASKHEVLMRYGITEQQYEAMDTYWQSKITDDASIGSRWERASADRRKWWQQRRR